MSPLPILLRPLAAAIATLAATMMLLYAEISRADPPSVAVDVASLTTSGGDLLRLHGSVGTGSAGVPIAGGHDCDGDGFRDAVMASMLADLPGRQNAGIVYVLFGDGTISGTFDSAVLQSRILEIHGDGPQEMTGSEVWMDDITGDGVGDVLLARQNYTPDPGRIGAGALTILIGGASLATHAATLTPFDLQAPAPGISLVTFVGANALDRLGIWMRTGDVTGDGIADIVVGADQEDSHAEANSGAAYVIRGGAHLATPQTIDLASFGATALAGHIARVAPPVGSTGFHLGATNQIGDLDGNGTAEVLVAAALNRAGAVIPADGAPPGSAEGTGGSTDGTVYIAWDDNFTGNPWAAGYTFDLDTAPGTVTTIDGGTDNISFGEEMLAGLDYDDDGNADLFVGDLVADGTPGKTRPASGLGHVLYDVASLKGLTFDMDTPPPGLVTVTFLGPAAGDIAADTAMQGDFDDDGFDDLAFSSPHGSPLGRADAGIIHVFFGQSGAWPATIDLQNGALPPPAQVRVTEVYGANGSAGGDSGDVLCYSGTAADMNGDGKTDILTNEMLGNGVLPAAEDTGNLVVLSGDVITNGIQPICGATPEVGCLWGAAGKSVVTLKNVGGKGDRFKWKWIGQTAVSDFLDPLGLQTHYAACVWDATGLILTATAPAGVTCNGLPCWRPGSKGFTYVSSGGPPEGIDRIRLKEGTGTKGKVVLKARGPLLQTPTLPLTLPVTVQVHADDGIAPECWEATYVEAKKNDAVKFKARGQ